MSERAVRKWYKRRFEFRNDVKHQQATEDDAAHLIISMKDREFTIEAVLNWPKDKYLGERIEALLHQAYSRGDADARADIRRVIGV